MPTKLLVIAASVLSFSFPASSARASYVQQGAKLIGTGALGAAYQGWSVALSADGNTAIVGGYADNYGMGAAWVYARSGDVWSQQGAKLVGTDGSGSQGVSVALSGDGNTAIVGGYGAAWVYTRDGVGVWSQQGARLVGTGAVGAAQQGWSVALSADGNTAVVGGFLDNAPAGAAWVYTRDGGGVWSQGWSVALSGDGNTAVVGGYGDNNDEGAAWVFTRSGGVWSQQGAKLVGTGAVGPGVVYQGWSVALSGDGNTAVVGGRGDDSYTGAAWVYTRSGGVWSQQGAKLVGTGAVEHAGQGWSVALSADGNTAVVGGFEDHLQRGAAWAYTRSGDMWSQQGAKLVGTGAVNPAYQGWSVALSADGSTAVVGGFGDNRSAGAAWVFVNASPTSGSDVDSLGFALAGARPNPTRGRGLNVVFALPTGATARLELLDLSGRRVLLREVGSLGAGRHTVNLAEGRRLAPGLYWVRLTQGANRRSTRVVVIE
jgi:hypothetical protein